MSHNSPRSLRVKQEARSRPDVITKTASVRILPGEADGVVRGGSKLAQLVAQSDAIQTAMRKIVQ